LQYGDQSIDQVDRACKSLSIISIHT